MATFDDPEAGAMVVTANRPVPSDLIRSVSRALRVLEAVGAHRQGLSVKQIARRCGLNLPTAYHLVRTLAYEGYLIRGGDGVYLVGLEVSDRFRDLAAAFREPDSVHDALRRCVRASGYSHYLARFVQGRVAITAVAEGARSPHLEDLIVGFDDGAHATALGKALLATLDAEERRRYLDESGMRRYTRATLTEPGALEYDLTQRTTDGVFIELNQYRDDVACAATLLQPHVEPDKRIVVGCAMPANEFAARAAAVRLRMRTVARSIARVEA